MPAVVRNMFEDYARKLLNVEDVIAVNSGTSALIAALWSLDLQPGDEVITTPFTFIATTNAILIAGGKPVFVDVCAEGERKYLIDCDKIEEKISNRTKAIIPVHLFGKTCNMPHINAIARKHNLVVIEDACQAFGAKTGVTDKSAGTLGDVGCFSFYKTKNISTFEGGMITVNKDSRLNSAKIRAIVDQGQVGKYNHEYIGFNFRLAEPLCLLALERMKLHMVGIDAERGLRGPEQGHYPKLVYQQPAYIKKEIKGNCPIAEKLAEGIKNNV